MKIHPSKQRPSHQNQRDRSKHKLEIDQGRTRQVPNIGFVQKKFLVQGNIGPTKERKHFVSEWHVVAPAHPAHEHSREGV